MSGLDEALNVLRAALGEGVRTVTEFRGETTVEIDPARIVAACRAVRDAPALMFTRLAGQTAVDYWPDEPRFAVIYQLHSLEKGLSLRLLLRLEGDAPSVASVVEVFPSANWHEREIYDMFGIRFSGHPDLRRLLMPADWQGHPLRKDYPLGYEEVQFTFNFDEIDRKKPYAKE
ncbi:MAG: NADH-quinone oxidoreductase subunit C [Chloroflexi bacterium]|nr:NADH-quinone oxidoreductase subunit C [Chloroflexota bacterium]